MHVALKYPRYDSGSESNDVTFSDWLGHDVFRGGEFQLLIHELLWLEIHIFSEASDHGHNLYFAESWSMPRLHASCAMNFALCAFEAQAQITSLEIGADLNNTSNISRSMEHLHSNLQL